MMKRTTCVARATLLALVAAVGVVLAAAPIQAGENKLAGVVNINTATAEELELLPGIGESRAQAVLALRKKNGGFKSIDELAQVKGIGPTAVEKLRPFVRTQGKTTARIE
jgi:competence protein ComEA